MFILFDSNVWVSQLGLQSRNGAAVRHFARRRHATVIIPEVVQLEVNEQLTRLLLGSRSKIENAYRYLLPVFGELRPLNLPSEEDIRKTVANIIPSLDVPIRKLPFNIDVARSSLMKVLKRIPPSVTTEEFRDGVIWAHCVELLDEGDVYLISEDKGFYEKRDYKRGLAQELRKEARERSEIREVKLLRNLTHLLEEIRVPITLDKDRLCESIMVSQSETIHEIMTAHGFGILGRVDGKVNCFATEDAQKVYIDFSFDHACQDISGKDRRDGSLKLKGFGFFNPETREMDEIRMSNILLEYPDWKPGGPARGTVFLSAHINAPMVHRIRFPIDPIR